MLRHKKPVIGFYKFLVQSVKMRGNVWPYVCVSSSSNHRYYFRFRIRDLRQHLLRMRRCLISLRPHLLLLLVTMQLVSSLLYFLKKRFIEQNLCTVHNVGSKRKVEDEVAKTVAWRIYGFEEPCHHHCGHHYHHVDCRMKVL